MIEFGSWSTTLAMGAAFGLAVALLLARSRTNTTANRLLALLIVVFVLKLTPYIIGFAGFYDAYPWLSFAPFSAGLAIGPLLYLHLRRLTSERLPRDWHWHLLPGAMQVLYRSVMFAQPMMVKNDWNSRIHEPWIDPAETFLELFSFAVYLWLSIRAYRAYQGWLDAHLSNREEFRIAWLRNVLIAFALAWPVWAVYESLSYSIAFDYFQRFPLYVFFTGLVFYLGLEGWRHAGTRYPIRVAATETGAVEDRDSGTREAASERDWPTQGQQWLERTEAAGWWRDPELNLERLARHLGTNTAYLSRAFNEGLGRSFNDAINRLRVAEVCRRLRDGERGDLLELAFAAGFSSKTSFNRVFKAHTGKTPSQFRESAVMAQTES
jgi:AraC-like DNA-binding protein